MASSAISVDRLLALLLETRPPSCDMYFGDWCFMRSDAFMELSYYLNYIYCC